ncbi:hypothetical protein [Larkinella sp. C7]|uniref:hypothetical protein n=1 Tax=Larkinella sp. C7 TaxID=2576607 RepID=UPI00111155C0|nr:hypothetical protein [Larkinella sp. C7]
MNFFALGDWSVYDHLHQQAVADQMELVATDLNPAFVIMAGDHFYSRGVSSLTDTHWQLSFENVYRGTHLPASFYVALDNHDYENPCNQNWITANNAPAGLCLTGITPKFFR